MNVREKAESIVNELKNNGFNGVSFMSIDINSADVQYEDAISDGHSPEIAEEWKNDYVLLSLYADMEFGDNQYNGFDTQTFEYDLRKKFIEVFGEGCLKDKDEFFSLDLWGGDIEIYDREKYKTYWKPIFRRQR